MKNSEISNEEHFYLNSSSRLQEYITNLKSCISIFESKLEKNMSVKESVKNILNLVLRRIH